MSEDSRERFSDLVGDYKSYRPDYPDQVVETLRARGFLDESMRVADVAAGTGVFTRHVLDVAAEVIAVEPNDPMRVAAVEMLGSNTAFRAAKGSAEDTGLEDDCVDVVTVAQAMHWFDVDAAAREFRRITTPPHRLVVLWNLRDPSANEVTAGYEDLIEAMGTHRESVSTRSDTDSLVAGAFERFEKVSFSHGQRFDWRGLRGRMMSSSYAPRADHRDHDEFYRRLREVYDAAEEDGTVDFRYRCVMYLGYV